MSSLNATRVENIAPTKYARSSDLSATRPSLTYSQVVSNLVKSVTSADNSVAGSETDESDPQHDDLSDMYISDTSSEGSYVEKEHTDDTSPKARLQMAYQDARTSRRYFQHRRNIILSMFNVVTRLEWVLSSPPPLEVYTENWNTQASYIPDVTFNTYNSSERGVRCNSSLARFPPIQGGREYPLARVHYNEIIVHFWFPKYRSYSFPLILPIWDGIRPVTKEHIAYKLIYATRILNKVIGDGVYMADPSSPSISPEKHNNNDGIRLDSISLNSLVHARGRHFVANLRL